MGEHAPGDLMALPRPPRAVIFDMDGTLFDSERLYADAFEAVVAELGCDVDPQFVLRCIGLPRPETLELFERDHGHLRVTEQIFDAWDAECDRRMAVERVDLKPGAPELLATLSSIGIPCAIATSSRRHHVERNFAGHDIGHHFSAIIAHGDYRHGKPAPDPFLEAARRLGIAPDHCLALEDSHNGVLSASSAGMMTVMVPDCIAPGDEHRQLCCHIAQDLHEVERLVAQSLGKAG
jgi:HAD superfamily hydrolase (TIGR01509 family)